MASSAKLFGCSLNVEAEEQRGGDYNTVAMDSSRSAVHSDGGEAMNLSLFNQSEIGVCNPYFSFLESNSDSGSVSMDSGPDPHNFFIDFFDRESHEVSTSGSVDLWEFLETEEEIDLGLGIGSGSGSGSGQAGVEVIDIDSDSDDGNRDIDTGLVEIGSSRTNVGGEAMVVDEELEWEDLQNAVDWVHADEPVQDIVVGAEEEEEEQVFFDVQHAVYVFEDSDEDSMANSGEMDFYISSFLDSFLDGLDDNHGDDYNAFFDNDTGITGSPPASKKFVNDLPVVDMTGEELRNGDIVCAICKDEAAVEEKVTRLPCRHYYHGDCIVPWLGIRNTCPVCRYELPTDDLEYETNRRLQRRGSRTDLISE